MGSQGSVHLQVAALAWSCVRDVAFSVCKDCRITTSRPYRDPLGFVFLLIPETMKFEASIVMSVI